MELTNKRLILEMKVKIEKKCLIKQNLKSENVENLKEMAYKRNNHRI